MAPGSASAPLTHRYPAGITRLQRWERAQELGLSPPGPIRDVLLEHRDNPDVTYRWVWGGMGGWGAQGILLRCPPPFPLTPVVPPQPLARVRALSRRAEGMWGGPFPTPPDPIPGTAGGLKLMRAKEGVLCAVWGGAWGRVKPLGCRGRAGSCTPPKKKPVGVSSHTV